ncbi:MAG: prolyl oligopeptidase family serine peptidase [Candidatus Sulfotelmatobacter sp.]
MQTTRFPRLSFFLFLALSLCTLAVFAQSPSIPKPPDTPKHPVTDEYHGVKVTDDYRWLENWDDPVVKQWSAAENARTREYLDHLPSRPAIKERLKKLVAESSASYYDLQSRAGMLFATRYQPPQQQPALVVMRSADDPASAKIIFDPNAASSKGSLAVDFYVPSFGGNYVAAAMSENGSEDSAAHIFEVATGKELSDVVPRVNFATAAGSIAWKADSSGFYYTRYPQGNKRPAEDANFYQQVYFHKLGTDPRQDTYVIGKDFPRIAEIQLHTSDDGRWLLAAVANGDGGQFAHYLMDSDGHWTQITHFEDGIVAVKFGPGGERGGGEGALYLLSRKDAPRGQILRLPLAQLNLTKLDLAQAKIIVPQSPGSGAEESDRASIEDFYPTFGHLYVVDVMGGPSRVRVFDNQGKALPAPALPPISAVYSTVPVGGGDVLFYLSTYLEPSAWYHFDAASGKATRTALFETAPVHYDDAEVVRAFATSEDGTRVPLNIIQLKGIKLDGSHPAMLTGYGGYGISTKPGFLGSFARMWLDQGGIYEDTNIRGGAEYGEEWHTAGNLTHKQNVFDDFLACAQYLIDQKYTSPAHLAILGGSNGGLLMGAAFTQRPDLFRAVVSFVGIYDMLRVELDPNGAFNVTEFGTVKDPDQFQALYAYSPYHHVKDGTAYPAILMPTGENDHRVNPMESRKMIARLQAATSSDRPILLRTTASAGHGIGTALDEQIEEDADVFSFLFDQLGIQYAAPGK